MTGYASTASAAALAARLGDAARPLLVAHAKPDGDAIGSLLALHRALAERGAAPTILLMGPVDPALLDAAESTPLSRLETAGLPAEEPDLVVVVDTGSWAQLEPLAAWLRERPERIVGIDHHRSGDDVAPDRLVDPDCASTTQVLVPVLDALGVELSPPVATALFLGLATDTGWFRFESARSAVYALAARLLEAGARKDWLYATVEQNARPGRLHLLARALGTLELRADGRAALMRLARADFDAAGCGAEDSGGFVNEPLAIGSVQVSALVSQSEPGIVRVSLRSKPAVGGADAAAANPGRRPEVVDVNQLAARFGGGGHRHAAGAKFRSEIDEALEMVRAALDGL